MIKQLQNSRNRQFTNQAASTFSRTSKTASMAEKNISFQPKGLTEPAHKYFGFAKVGKYVRRYKLIFRSGDTLSIPYATLPLIKCEDNRRIIILATDLTVTITGRGLGKLESYLSDERIQWIKESGSGLDDQDEDVFIAAIRIEGENLL